MRSRRLDRDGMAPLQKQPPFDEMLHRARDGDVVGFDLLYRNYAGRIQAFAMARGAADPEVVTNDTMVRAFQNLNRFSGDEAAFMRWIFTIARNRLIDAHRSETRRPVLSDDDAPEQPVASAEDEALEHMSRDAVMDRLSLLTVEQREVIVLRLIEDLSISDVAEIVNRPATAVKALQRRGLQALQRQILAEEVS